MSPSTLEDLFAAADRNGSSTVAAAAAQRSGAVLAVLTVDAAGYRRIGVNARAISESFRGIDAPIVLDPSILPVIAAEWARETDALRAEIRRLEAKLRAIRALCEK